MKTNLNKKIPTGWREVKLGDFADIKTGGKDNQNKRKDGDYPFFVRSEKIERIDSYSYDGEAILMPGEGRIGEIFHYINGKFDYHQRVYKISDFKDGLVGKFLYFYLQKNFYKEAKKHSVKATVDSLRLPVFTDMEILLPSKPEQQKIAEILMAVDADIEKVGDVVAKTEKLKKGLMQELFMPKEGWEEKKVKDVAKLRKEKFDPKKEDSEKYIGLEHIEQATGQLLEYSNSNTTKSTKSRFQKSDILFNKLRPYLKKYWSAHFDGVCTTELLVFINKENILKEFLYYILSSDDFISFINSKTFGTKMPRADWSLVKDYGFCMPDIPEQKQIAETLSAIDQKIQINKTLQAKLINLKKGLMQDLLSGEVRVKL